MKDPAFLFYPGDWMGGTQWLTFEQKGCYIELLILQFNTGQFTEAQAKQVLSICFESAWPVLKQKFVFKDGFYFNERLRLEIEKRKNYSESRRINGLKAKKYPPKTDKHMHKHMESESENTNKDECISYLEDDEDIKSDPTSLNWRFNFNIYMQSLKDAYEYLSTNKEYIEKQEKFNPNVDIRLSLEKAVENFWGTKRGWVNMRSKEKGMIDWTSQLADSISLNKVYKNGTKAFTNNTEGGQGPAGTNPKLARTYSGIDNFTRKMEEESRGFTSGVR